MVLKWHDRGYGSPDISRLLNMPEEEVINIIFNRTQKTASQSPEFIEPPLFGEP
ncbi:hypothetical protein [Bifidobacterium sp. UTBIF-68]|uniref:hypothetical protein n=1 Tax=Bifidobacterium sp. UTBIF-68 TaxID=1465262 RepID=UPI0015E28CF4|nr:hypothetical protein [Bifidobacterium sp. UTBIF-68]